MRLDCLSIVELRVFVCLRLRCLLRCLLSLFFIAVFVCVCCVCASARVLRLRYVGVAAAASGVLYQCIEYCASYSCADFVDCVCMLCCVRVVL